MSAKKEKKDKQKKQNKIHAKENKKKAVVRKELYVEKTSFDKIALPLDAEAKKSIKDIRVFESDDVCVPESVQKFESLNVLHFVNCKALSSFNSCFSLPMLRELSLVGGAIEKIPPEIQTLTKLKYLALSNNRIKRLPMELYNLTGLEILHLNGNEISYVSSKIFNLAALTALSLKQNCLGEALEKNVVGENETRGFVADLVKEFIGSDKARSSALTLLLIRMKRKEECGVLGVFPLEVVRSISQYVYSTRKEDCWTK